MMRKQKFEKAKTFCQGEYSGDEDALYEVMGDDAAVTVTLDSDTANKLSIKVLQKYLGILGNGAFPIRRMELRNTLHQN